MTTPPTRAAEESTPVPGPDGLGIVDQARRLFSDDATAALMAAQRQYGDVVELPMPGDDPTYLLSNPAHIRRVLETNQGNYRKSDVYRNELRDIFGRGLLTSEGTHWANQHRLIRPMFRSDTVRSFTDLVADETDAMLDRWAECEGPIRLLESMERVALLVIGKAMFSADMEPHADDIAASIRTLRRQFQRRTSVLPTVPKWIPTPHNRRVVAALERLDRIVYDLIEERRANPSDHADDLLSMLLSAGEATDERMSDEQIRDELMTFLLAGHETTAAALTWTWYLLARNPEIHRRLHESVLDGSKSGQPAFDGEDTSFVAQCVQESMRLYPPVPVFSREAVEADRAGDYEIPAGSEVLLSQFVVHRHPEYWDSPLSFRPERFEPGAAENRSKYSYFPFGGGARMCIGRQLALMEARVVLERAVRRFRLTLDSPTDERVGVSSAVTMVPDEPIEMRVESW